MIKIISIDFQKDFTQKGGPSFRPRKSVDFVKQEVVPYLKEKGIKIAEIISDYRPPRPGDRGDLCYPGKEGYQSEIDESVKDQLVWVKCMNSPIWVRDNIGVPDVEPGLPYQDPTKFNNWLKQVIGKPDQTKAVLMGLTVDCCVLCAAQELNWRGYKVNILKEGVDSHSGSQEEKEMILANPPLTNWVKVITWLDLKNQLS